MIDLIPVDSGLIPLSNPVFSLPHSCDKILLQLVPNRLLLVRKITVATESFASD